VKVADDGTDPTKALANIQALYASGITIFIGTSCSAEANAILSYADANHLLLIAPTASSISLAIPNDYFFRVTLPDTYQGPALTSLLLNKGFKAAIVLYDNSNPALTTVAKSFVQHFQSRGGTVLDQITYSSVTTGAYDFSPQLGQLEADYKTALTQYGKVAILVQGGDETGTMIKQASLSYPDLLQTTWFGSNIVPGDPVVIQNAGPILANVSLLSTTVVITPSPLYLSLESRLAVIVGATPSPYALYGYDAAMVAYQTILACDKYDAVCAQSMVITVADQYFGATGWTHMDQNGDRDIQAQSVWGVANIDGKVQWAQFGSYYPVADVFTWYPTPVPS